MSKKYTLRQKVTYSVVTFFLLTLLIVGIGEVVTRILYQPTVHFNKAILDDELGWVPKPHYTKVETLKDYKKVPYEAHFQSAEYGFREFGDPASSKIKVFFLGDSYTQSVEVSNEHTFFNILKDSLDIEVFAFGQSGYGTLQQYMILDKYLDLIQPDLIVLQTCDNDFLDNHYVLEREGGYNVRLRRPYLTLDKEIVYRMPIPEWKHRLSYSKFLTLLASRLEWLFTSEEERVIAEAYIAEEEQAYPPYNEAIKITGMILDRVVERVPDSIRLIGFSSSVYQPQLDDMRRLFEERGIPLYDDSAQLLYDVRGEGRSVHSADGFHWNIGGHQVIAEGLLPILRTELERIRSSR
jgi:hypothetical protein